MLRPGDRIGKYRIRKRLGEGGFAEVFEAVDTVEAVPIALKVPLGRVLGAHKDEVLREVRLNARLEHRNILAVKNAEFVGDRLVIAYPLGEGTLADRLRRRLALATAVSYGEQMLQGLAYAHSRRIIHCDVKPENLILFPGGRLKLCDFGLARTAYRTIQASGSGTVGYIAPEQAMGKPSARSDVFSAALVLYRMLAGVLPEWPFSWPLPGLDRLRRKAPAEMIDFLRRGLSVDQRRRYADAGRMLEAYRRLRPKILRNGKPRRNRKKRAAKAEPRWPRERRAEFLRRHRRDLDLRTECSRCGGPMSEAMAACPWCGRKVRRYRGPTRFPARCSRCGRGRKLDWRYCGWCYGAGFREVSERSFPDKRYEGQCGQCRGPLMPFLRYCPWCRRKVRRTWPVPGGRGSCPGCRRSVAGAYWDYCAWCARSLRHGKRAAR